MLLILVTERKGVWGGGGEKVRNIDVRERLQSVWFSSPSTNEIPSLGVLDLSNYVFITISSSSSLLFCLFDGFTGLVYIYNVQLFHP